jgi:hypothetical protein
VAGVVAATLFFCVSTVAAARITSPNYQVDGNLGGSFGGEANSSSYRMTAVGGEAVVGNGASGSYLLDQQDAGSEVKTMQLGVQPSGLVGFYPMDENAGTSTADASRYQHNSTFANPVAWRSDGKIGAALNINGTTDNSGTVAIATPDHANMPSGSQMSFEAWVNASDPSLLQKVVAAQWRSAFSTAWYVSVNGSDIRVSVAPTSTSVIGESYVMTNGDAFSTANVWRHVAFVYDGNLAAADRIKIYIDGTSRAASLTGASAPASLQDANEPFTIGGLTVGSAQSSVFPGSIDHVKLFNRALSAAEVKAEYNAQNTGASSGFGLEPTPTTSTSAAIDAVVRTNSPNYTIGVQQDHDLQNGATTIPAVGGSIASPATWTEGATRGFGFTLTAAPVLDAKWSSGTKYAALPNALTTFYSGTGNINKTPEVVSAQLRLHPAANQPLGTYGNAVTYTGTMTP